MSMVADLLEPNKDGHARSYFVVQQGTEYHAYLMPSRNAADTIKLLRNNAVAVARGATPDGAVAAFAQPINFEEHE